MTATLPSLARLKANPAWASLPLFDRTGWKRTAFGEFVQSIGERAEPRDAQGEIYVGLEHLDPQCLHIRRWGKGSDVISGKLRFRKGDIIFGKRRAYQRKLAVAEFGGICSAHAMVIRARPDKVLPEFLPFLMMHDRFMNRAVEISVGSLSPTINWTTLKLETFDLPPLDQQRRIAEILWAVEELIVSSRKNIKAIDDFELSLLHAAELDRGSIRAAKTLFPAVKLEALCSHIVDCLHSTPEILDDGYPVIRTADVVPGQILLKGARKVSEETFKRRTSRLKPEPGDVFYSREGERFGIAAPVPEGSAICLGQRMMHFRAAHDVEPSYLLAMLNSPRVYGQVLASVIGTTSPHVNIRDIKTFSVPKPPLAEQRRVGKKLAELRGARFALESHISVTSLMHSSAINSFA